MFGISPNSSRGRQWSSTVAATSAFHDAVDESPGLYFIFGLTFSSVCSFPFCLITS